MKAKLTFFVLFLLMIYPVSALEYSVQVNSPSQVNAYEGDKVSSGFSATITNAAGVCDISCDWVTSAGSGTGIKVPPDSGSKSFNYDVRAEGSSGVASYTLTVSCDRISSWECWSSPDQKTLGPYSFKFLYSGDGTCTTTKEKCATYNQYISAPNDCQCNQEKECKPNSNRGADDKGCSTFCGNKLAEKQWESCSDCQIDIGKCDGVSCFATNECEGKYCVHEKCSHLAYITGDTYCDKNIGETCKNSSNIFFRPIN